MLVLGVVAREQLATHLLGPEVLRAARRVVGDDRVRGVEDALGGPVVLLDHDHRRVGERLLEPHEVPEVGPAELVDAVVRDDAIGDEVVRLRDVEVEHRSIEFDPLDPRDRVGPPVLVDHDHAVAHGTGGRPVPRILGRAGLGVTDLLRRAAVGIDRQQQRSMGVIGPGYIGLVDARIGHHQAQPVLDDQDARPCPHDAHRFRRIQSDQARILLDVAGEFYRFGRGFDGREIDHAPFGLGHDLLRQHEDVAATWHDATARQPLADQGDEIVVLAHQRNAGDGEDLDVAAFHRPVPRTQPKRLRRRGSTCSL